MQPPRHLYPIMATLAGIAVFSVMDGFMKAASIRSGAFEAVLWRNVAGSLLGLPVWLVAGRIGGFRDFRPGWRRIRVHLLRSAVVSGMSVLFFWGLVRVPMAEGMALSFIAPLIALYMAALFLGEPVTRRALGASALGLAGVGLIALARSGAPGDHHEALLGVLAVLASAVAYAANLVLQRHQAQMSSPAEIAFFQSLFVLLCLLPWAPGRTVLPDAQGLAWLTAAAALALVSLMLLAWGYARAEAHHLLPLEYSGFFWAALMGYWWFDEPLGWATIAGAALIVAGCVIGTSSPPPEQVAL
jgi:S-adenosylmethionine uptake transporter